MILMIISMLISKVKNYDTISGFIIDKLGRIPKDNEEQSVEYENIIFKIEEVKEKRIQKIKVYIQAAT